MFQDLIKSCEMRRSGASHEISIYPQAEASARNDLYMQCRRVADGGLGRSIPSFGGLFKAGAVGSVLGAV